LHSTTQSRPRSSKVKAIGCTTSGSPANSVTLNPAAHWRDGKPVTGWDVRYTFELGKKYKGLRVSPR